MTNFYSEKNIHQSMVRFKRHAVLTFYFIFIFKWTSWWYATIKEKPDSLSKIGKELCDRDL